MRGFTTVLATLIVAAALIVLAALGFVLSGVYNVAATDKHWPITRWLVDVTVERSVAQHAGEIQVPELDTRAKLLQGAASYERMCSHCHTPPGADTTPVAKGLSPEPPALAHAAEEYNAAQLFWIVKHGIKMTGMPAWGPTHADRELWPLVAFMQALPEMDGQRYRQLVKTAQAQEAGHHGGNKTKHTH